MASYWFNSIRIDRDVVVWEGDTYGVFFQSMSWWDSLTMKIYIKWHFSESPVLYPGVYRFETPLSYQEFLDKISIPPQPIMVKVTLLEWWSSRDYDALLAKKGYAPAKAYRDYITNPEIISKRRQLYPFLPANLVSLEGFLYPDTYHIDANKGNAVQQLVQLQLENFNKKVRLENIDLFNQFDAKLVSDGFGFKMSLYSVLKLASIIENEEKNDNNKQTIAGLFLNRIENNMQLGADVTLCYGHDITYDQCTPRFIVDHLYDKTNPYNTRQQAWLTPTPISNPSIASIRAVLDYSKTDYLYYLHDTAGRIYYATTLEGHNANKQKHLP